MFCVYCGRQIPEGGTCPCQAPSGQTPDNNISNAGEAYNNFQYNPQPNYQQPNYQRPQIEGPMLKMKELFSGTAFLLVAIMISVIGGLSILSGGFSVFTVLEIVAVWITYSSAKKANQPIKTTGMTIGSGMIIAEIVFLCIGFAFILIGILLCTTILRAPINIFLSELTSRINLKVNMVDLGVAIWIILATVMICIFLFQLFYLISLRNSILCLRGYSMNKKPTQNVSLFPVVYLFITAITGFVSNVLFSAFNISGVINEFISSILEEANINYNYTFRLSYFAVISAYISALLPIFEAVFLLKARRVHKEISENENY